MKKNKTSNPLMLLYLTVTTHLKEYIIELVYVFVFEPLIKFVSRTTIMRKTKEQVKKEWIDGFWTFISPSYIKNTILPINISIAGLIGFGYFSLISHDTLTSGLFLLLTTICERNPD